MTQVVDSQASPSPASTLIVSEVAGENLWVVLQRDAEDDHFRGFIELALDAYIVVSGTGQPLGNFSDLDSACAAFAVPAAEPRDQALLRPCPNSAARDVPASWSHEQIHRVRLSRLRSGSN